MEMKKMLENKYVLVGAGVALGLGIGWLMWGKMPAATGTP